MCVCVCVCVYAFMCVCVRGGGGGGCIHLCVFFLSYKHASLHLYSQFSKLISYR